MPAAPLRAREGMGQRARTRAETRGATGEAGREAGAGRRKARIGAQACARLRAGPPAAGGRAVNKTVVQFRGPSRSGVQPGTRLNDIYEVELQIAAGGMGEIYRGRLVETGDPVAIKMIKPEFADNESVLALFRKEASALHHLHHDSIVRYYIFGIDRTINRAYLAMEFVEGSSLSDLLTRRSLTVQETTELRQRLAAGLQAAHDKGIIHRDISPDNVILPEENVRKAKIIDFGIARSTKLGQATVIGDGFAGKYNYVSPEQLGMFGGEVTPRSDIYSLGLVLAECLRGKPIDMSGSQADVIEKRRVVPDLSEIDDRLQPLIARMLAPDPKDRPESMVEVAEWVWTPPAAKPRGRKAAEGAEAGARTKPGIALMAGAAIALAAAGAGGYFMLREPAGRPQSTQETASLPSLPPPETAALNAPPAVTTPPAAPLSQAERIVNYIRYYDADPCLFARPLDVTPRSASVATLSASSDAVRAFQADFAQVNGFEASVTAGTILPAQCPAVPVLQQLDGRFEPGFDLRLPKAALKPGDRAVATIAGGGWRSLGLLVVDEDGSVRNLTSQLRPGGDGMQLDLRLDDPARGKPARKLLVAIAASQPLPLFSLGSATTGAPLADLMRILPASSDGVSVTAQVVTYD